jgi:hypothetical protein
VLHKSIPLHLVSHLSPAICFFHVHRLGKVYNTTKTISNYYFRYSNADTLHVITIKNLLQVEIRLVIDCFILLDTTHRVVLLLRQRKEGSRIDNLYRPCSSALHAPARFLPFSSSHLSILFTVSGTSSFLGWVAQTVRKKGKKTLGKLWVSEA